MEAQQKEMKKGWKIFWLIFDIIIFGTYFLYFFLLLDPIGLVRYYDGLNDTKNMLALSFFVFCWPVFLLYYLLLIIRIIFFKSYFVDKKKLWSIRIIVFIAVLLCNPLTVIMIPTPLFGPYNFFNGFYQRVTENFDVEKVRVWMRSLDEEMFDGKVYYLTLRDDIPFELPAEITNVSDKIFYLVLSKDGQNHFLGIEYGTSFNSWGIEVVLEDIDIEIPYNYKELGMFRKLDKGAYVYLGD